MNIKSKFKLTATALGFILVMLTLLGNVPMESFAKDSVVDLVSDIIVKEDIVANHGLTYAYSKLNHSKNGWQSDYSLFNIASPKDSPGAPGYVIWKVRPGAGQRVSMEVNFKKWSGVGNGGVLNKDTPKLAFYATEDESLAASGNPEGWMRIGQDVQWDINTYDYTITTDDPIQDDGYVYIMMYCISTGDGAWVDGVTFTIVDDGTKNVKGVTFEQKNITIPQGFLQKLNLIFFPKDAADQRVSWKSSDNSIVSVENVVLKAVGVGDATVTITTMDGGLTAQCNVTVTKDPAISLTDGSVFDAEILNTSKNPYGFPYTCFFSAGQGQSTPKVVKWGSVVFRDLGLHASAVYKLHVPAGESAVMQLSLVTDYVDQSDILNGVVGLGNERESPRLNIFYSTSPMYYNDPDSAEWTRVDADSDWNGKIGEYTFTVGPVEDTERDVYVKIVSTYISGQGAWIESLSFMSSKVDEVGLVVKSPTKIAYTSGEKFDATGIAVGIKYSDGTIRQLNSDEYEIKVPDLSGVGTTRVTVETKDRKLSGGFDIFLADQEAAVSQEGAGSEDSASAMRYTAGADQGNSLRSDLGSVGSADGKSVGGESKAIIFAAIIALGGAALGVSLKYRKKLREEQSE